MRFLNGARDGYKACQACINGTATVVIERVVENAGLGTDRHPVVDHLHLCEDCNKGGVFPDK